MSMKPILSRIAGVGLAAVVAGTLLLAQTPAPKTVADKTPAKVAAGSGMVVAIDKESGTLRAPTPEELKALGLISSQQAASEGAAVSGVAGRGVRQPAEVDPDSAATLGVAAAPVISAGKVTRVGNAEPVLLDESFREYMVAVRNADGSLSYRCVSGKPEAQSKAAPKQEDRNDR